MKELSEREKCHVEIKEILKIGVKKILPAFSILLAREEYEFKRTGEIRKGMTNNHLRN